MSNNPEVSNGSLPNIKPRATDVGDEVVIPHFRLDVGSGTSENPIEGALPVQEGLSIPAHDYIAISYPTSTQEVYVYKSGGVSGDIVATITVNYTDSTKVYASNIAKT